MTKNDVPILEASLKGSVNPGIQYSMRFAGWEAAIGAGATLTELLQWERGEVFPNWFKQTVIAWWKLHKAVRDHSEAAAAEKANKSKK